MNFQVTVLKILVSYPGGKASLEDLKRDMAILATSGRDWSDRTKRLAAKVPSLDIFTQGLIDRQDGCWIMPKKDGRSLHSWKTTRQLHPFRPLAARLRSPRPRPLKRLQRMLVDGEASAAAVVEPCAPRGSRPSPGNGTFRPDRGACIACRHRLCRRSGWVNRRD